jgi:hypothetical protein
MKNVSSLPHQSSSTMYNPSQNKTVIVNAKKQSAALLGIKQRPQFLDGAHTPLARARTPLGKVDQNVQAGELALPTITATTL